MRIGRVLLGIFVLGGAAWIGPLPRAAEAHDDWGRGARWHRPCDAHARLVRSPCHPSTRVLVPRRLGHSRYG